MTIHLSKIVYAFKLLVAFTLLVVGVVLYMSTLVTLQKFTKVNTEYKVVNEQLKSDVTVLKSKVATIEAQLPTPKPTPIKKLIVK